MKSTSPIAVSVLALIWAAGATFAQTTHAEAVTAACFTPDGVYLATGSSDKSVKLWEVGSWKRIHTYADQPGGVLSIAFSPDGKFMAIGTSSGEASLWDWAKAKKVRALKGNNGAVHSLCFSPTGKSLGTACQDGYVRIFAVPNGVLVRSMARFRSGVSGVDFHPNGKYLASTCPEQEEVISWNVETGGKALYVSRAGAVRSVRFSPDGASYYFGLSSGRTQKWPFEPSADPQTDYGGHSGDVNEVALGGDGKILASASDDKTVRVYDAASGSLLHALEEHTDKVKAVCVSSDGKYVVSGGLDKNVLICDLSSGGAVSQLLPEGGVAKPGSGGAGDGGQTEPGKALPPCTDPDKYKQCLKDCLQGNNPSRCADLAEVVLALDEDWAVTLKVWEKACTHGDCKSCGMLGGYYTENMEYDEAITWFSRACNEACKDEDERTKPCERLNETKKMKELSEQ